MPTRQAAGSSHIISPVSWPMILARPIQIQDFLVG